MTMNPSITTIKIGKRELEPLTVYPLSIPDQIQVAELITEALQAFFLSGEAKAEVLATGAGSGDPGAALQPEDQIKFIAFLVDLFRNNMVQILALTTDFATDKQVQKNLLPKITNEQAADIAISIYRTNYEKPVKNVMSLFKGKIRAGLISAVEQMPNETLKGLLRPLWGDSPNTDSNISTAEDSEKAA